jgi:hypothetical protein
MRLLQLAHLGGFSGSSCPSEEGVDIIGISEGCWLTRYPIMKNLKCHSNDEFHKQFVKMQTKGLPIAARELGTQIADCGVPANLPWRKVPPKTPEPSSRISL